MKKRSTAWLTTFLLVVLSCPWCYPARAATPYKTYVIKRYKHWDILCDIYRVKKGDHIWELLRRRGCLAERDLANFTAILKRLNPHIKNVDRIYPRQEILIPLKKMKPQQGASAAEDRQLTIPFLPDILYSAYTVRPGDYLVKIAAEHHGLEVDQLPQGYLRTLKDANPGIKNLNRIYPGQKIRIPEIASGRPAEIIQSAPPSAEMSPVTPSSERPKHASPWSAISVGVKPLGGKLIESGHYFFPAKDKGEVKLDLSAFPVIELQGGRRLLLDTEGLSEEIENVLRAFWKPLTIVRKEPEESRRSLLDRVFRTIHGGDIRLTVDIAMSDIGIHVTLRGDWIFVQKGDEHNPPGYHCITLITDPDERTSGALRDYLAEKNIQISDVLPEGVDEDTSPESQERDALKPAVFTIDASNQEIFLVEFVKAIGYSYNWNAPLSFPHGGSHVQIVTDLIHGEDGLDVVVDFGELSGDKKSAVEAAGVKVLSVRPEDPVPSIARNFFKTAGFAWTEDPIFFGANRNVFKTTSLTIPGFLATQEAQRKVLLTSAPLPPKVCDFLRERKISVVKMKPR